MMKKNKMVGMPLMVCNNGSQSKVETFDADKRKFLKKGILGILAGAALGLLSRIPFVEAGRVVQRAEFKNSSETTITESTGAAYTINMEDGNVFELTLTANSTLTFSKAPSVGKAGSFTLILVQDGTGSRTVTWPAAVDWAGGTAPTLTTAANSVDVLVFVTVDGGQRWYGFSAGADLK